MKKYQKAVIISVAAVLLAGCATKKDIEQPQENRPEEQMAADLEDNEEEQAIEPKEEVANPWRECTEDEAVDACHRLFKAPDGAEDV